MRPKTRKSDPDPSPSNEGAEEREAERSDPGHPLQKKPFDKPKRYFWDGVLLQQANSGPLEELPFKCSVVEGVEPRDKVETLLAAQMAEVHLALMRFSRRLVQADNLAEQDIAERAVNKLARTFTSQIEALKRYRTGGDQKVTVGQVSVSDGGQAIVGNVTRALPETTPEMTSNSRPALTDARQTPMTIIGEPERAPALVQRRLKNDRQSPA
jgi:hypothetical protein